MKRKNHSSYGDRFHDSSKWIFLGFSLLFLVIGVLALRQNNIRSIELRDAVLEADKKQANVEEALQDLREHIHSHMNADLSAGGSLQQPVQLVHRYERLVAQEEARTNKANEAIYTQAQKHCERQNPTGFSGGTRVSCIEEYVLNNGEKEQEIPDNLYKFDFVAPRWSPDLAGWSLVLSGLFMVLFLVKVVLDRLIKAELQD